MPTYAVTYAVTLYVVASSPEDAVERLEEGDLIPSNATITKVQEDS
jgi:hypothetical protein